MNQKNTFLKWNLRFTNDPYEKLFAESKRKFQKPMLNILMVSGLIICQLIWIVNPYNQPMFEGMMLGYQISLIVLTALFYLINQKSRPFLDWMVTALILYFLIGILESTRRNQNLWGKLIIFNVGTLIEFVLVILILAKIFWIKIIIIYILIIFLIVIRYTPFNENKDAKYYPLLMQIQNFIILSCAAYFMEKRERQRFYEIKTFENSLNSFKELITNYLPLPIIILNKEELVFYNKEAEYLFNTGDETEIYNKLLNITVSGSYHPHEISKDGKSSIHSFLHDESSPLHFETERAPFTKVINNCFESLERVGFVSISTQAYIFCPVSNNSKFYEMKFKNVFWEGNNSLIVILAENKTIEKVNLLKEQAEYKNKLLATVSHDLRTPLYGIIGMISICEDLVEDPYVKKNLTIALRSSHLLQLMINDILDYSQISNGKLRLNNEVFDLWDVIKDVSKLIKFQAKKKGLEFFKENHLKERTTSTFIKNDQNRIKQILLNLMSNALKFTDNGFIRVSLEKAEWPYREDQINPSPKRAFLIKVIDTGIGIEKDDIQKLFKLFGKSTNNKSVERNKSGIGLGLAISKSLLEMLNDDPGGTHIHVYSTYGEGSTFSFLIKSNEQAQNEEDFFSDYNEKELSGNKFIQILPKLEVRNRKENSLWQRTQVNFIRILLVDDDQINILVGSSYLKQFKNICFETANNGRKALEMISQNALNGSYFDLILMDCNMPVMDGFQAAKTIKGLVKNQELPEIYIIACTANASMEDRERCFDAGMDDFLIKPFMKKDLEEKIKQFMENRET